MSGPPALSRGAEGRVPRTVPGVSSQTPIIGLAVQNADSGAGRPETLSPVTPVPASAPALS